MRPSKWWCFLLLFLMAPLSDAVAQKNKPNPAEHEEKVKDIVAFLEYVLNTIGSGTTSARDKDVMITESYTKIFRDAKVQIEDDLDEKRNVVTNKDVQAYLKDVDFFFDDVKFEFAINKIQGKVNANGKLFYTVNISRNLKGTTVTGKTVNSTIPRFIEINYNPEDQDLRIVSIYTHEFDESESLKNWWKQLSYEWQAIFKRNLNITHDSVGLEDMRNMASIEVLDLSQNQYIQDIEPLGQLVGLRRLNLAGTEVSDLTPIRNLTELTELDISSTLISDLSPMRYASKLTQFNISGCPVTDISVVEKLTALEFFDASGTPVTDFVPLQNLTALRYLQLASTDLVDLSPLAALENLTELNISGTHVPVLDPIKSLSNIETLTLDSTLIADLTALTELKKLKVVSFNDTQVGNLRPLLNLPALERVYCDHTQITRSLADAFMTSKPGVLVIFDTEDLKTWWENLPAGWLQTLRDKNNISADPTKEELARVTNMDSLDISGIASIRTLEPLRRIQKLQFLNASKTNITDLTPLSDHRDIRGIDIASTPVGDLSVVGRFPKIAWVKVNDSGIQSIDALSGKSSLQKLYADGLGLEEAEVRDFLLQTPGCLVMYKTDSLTAWWDRLPEAWQRVFAGQIKGDVPAETEELHELVESVTLTFSDAGIDDLSPLTEFVRLRKLQFSGTSVQDLNPLSSITTLRSLQATLSPVRDLQPLENLEGLEELDISNTPVEDLKPVGLLANLRQLHCAGTQVSRLDALAGLQSLETLDCSNTPVKKLDPVQDLSLKVLKCFNTRVSSKRVEAFRQRNPECNVIFY